MPRWVAVATAGVLALCGCGEDGASGDADLGPIEDILGPADRAAWPGVEQANGRLIPLVTAFADELPSAYWFIGFGTRRTADAFFFCREGDTACPLDEHRRLDWSTIVGHPLFSRIPGDPDFSPFWQMWTVTVPASFTPDSVKTIASLDRLGQSGVVRVERLRLDFGEWFGERVGPADAVLHCALVLAGTRLEGNGGPMPDGSGPSLPLDNRHGWFEGHRVVFVDFSPADGVLPAARDSENRALMRNANLYVIYRSCEGDPRPAICDLPGFPSPARRPVSERGLGQDITGDGDARDSNNVAGALPCSLQRPTERPYSPLWAPLGGDIAPGADVDLIDTTGDQTVSDIKSVDALFRFVEERALGTPVAMFEDETGAVEPGNEGQVFFNCPVPVPVDFVPHPCGTLSD